MQSLIREILVVLVHTPSFIEDIIIKVKNEKDYIEIGINQLISIFMLSRLYMIVKLFGRFSKYQTGEVIKIW